MRYPLGPPHARLGLALAACLSLSAPAAAQYGFGDLILGQRAAPGPASPLALGNSADGLGWRTARHPTMPGWEDLQRRLLAADRSLSEALEAYLGVVREADEQRESISDWFHFFDLTRYRRGTAQADRLGAALEAAAGELVPAGEALPGLEQEGEPLWALEGRSEWLRQATLLHQLHDWAAGRRMDYNGPSWGDAQERPVLATRTALTLPDLPDEVGVREGTVLTSGSTQALVRGYVEVARAAVEEARGARDVLQREAVERTRGSSGWITLRYRTTSIFDALIKPQAGQVMSGLARAKGALNAAVVAAEAHNHGRASDASRDALRRVMRDYAEVVAWGEFHYLQGADDRQLYVLDGDDFGDVHRVDTGGPEAEYLEWLLGEYRGRTSRASIQHP